MKKLISSAFLVWCLLVTSNLCAQHKLEVTIINIDEMKGSIRVSLFNNDKDFLEKTVDSKVVKVSAKEAAVVFEKLKSGEYAVSVIHDLNDNKELDTGFMGMPKEPYGFSNNARGKFGPPDFDQSKFILKGDVKTAIKIE